MEKAAIKFCKENKIRLSIILPTGIYGDAVLPEHLNHNPFAWLKQAIDGGYPRHSETPNDSASMIHVRDLANMFLATRNITIETTFKDSLMIYADSNRIFQVFSNLLKNAVEAMPNSGKITINVEEDLVKLPTLGLTPSVHISIKDTGVGIDQKHLDHLFDPFFSTKYNNQDLGFQW